MRTQALCERVHWPRGHVSGARLRGTLKGNERHGGGRRGGAPFSGEMMLMEFDRIDHVVFTVCDIAATCDFYARALGLRVLTFDDGRRTLQVGQGQVNLHQQGHEFEPKALRPGPGTQDICLVTTTPMHEVISHLRDAGIAIIEGPVPRTGARGTMESVYLCDPDGNLVEVARYPQGGG